jgi:large subunit ribosomal protein L25
MATFTLSATERDTAIKPKFLATQGIIPAIMYGPLIQPVSLQVPLKDFKVFNKAYDHTSLIELEIGKQKSPVLIRKIQKHPVTDVIQNIEFYAVDPTTKITLSVPILLTGIAPTVKIDRGVLFQNLSSLKVKCIPSAIIPEIVIDISIFTSFEKAIFVRDIKLPEGMESATSPDELVVKVLRPKVEEATVTTVAPVATPVAAPADAPATKK